MFLQSLHGASLSMPKTVKIGKFCSLNIFASKLMLKPDRLKIEVIAYSSPHHLEYITSFVSPEEKEQLQNHLEDKLQSICDRFAEDVDNTIKDAIAKSEHKQGNKLS